MVRPDRSHARASLTFLVVFLAGGCGRNDAAAPDPAIEREVVGDTTFVRSTGLGVWGDTLDLVEELRIGTSEDSPTHYFGRVPSVAATADGRILVVDMSVPELRMFSSEGEFLRRVGRGGSGPGEYREPDGGLTVLFDGRIVLRDPNNGRINIYSREGEYLGEWLQPGIRSSTPLYADSSNHSYNIAMLPERDARGIPMYGMVRLGPDGTVVDTLIPPRPDHVDPMVRAEYNGQRNAIEVPFTARALWTIGPGGWFIHGVSDRYRVILDQPGSPIVIERPDFVPVPVSDGERATLEASITRNMRDTDPGWSWSGPQIPATKPPFKTIHVGRDGRVWVGQFQPGYRVVDTVTVDGEPRERERWHEPVLFDVFDPDGTYLGAVRGPRYRISTWASPVMDGDQMWAIAFDQLDVPYVVRLRITRR